MSCSTHKWMFDSQCPRCPHTVVVAMGDLISYDGDDDGMDHSYTAHHNNPGLDRLEEPREPLTLTGDEWEIPAFLLRRADGGFQYPSLHGDERASKSNTDAATYGRRVSYNHQGDLEPLKFWSDARLLTALSDHTISVIDRQPILEEAKKRHDQVKGYERQRPFL